MRLCARARDPRAWQNTKRSAQLCDTGRIYAGMAALAQPCSCLCWHWTVLASKLAGGGKSAHRPPQAEASLHL